MKYKYAFAATLAADYSKAAFTVTFLGGIVALFLKRNETPAIDILLLIATGAVITAALVAFAFFFKSKEHRND
ncbi:MAG: hypothetical protein LBU08_03505 [Tannerellaceae bacterium]|jgi:hypothetical protein|nr:hypothetical protein [Tannerellaceae bacterium]